MGLPTGQLAIGGTGRPLGAQWAGPFSHKLGEVFVANLAGAALAGQELEARVMK